MNDMRLKEYYKKYLKPFFRSRIVKTIWFNWRMLPPQQAWKLPVFLYGNTEFRSLTGSIVINGPVMPGMIKIGKNDYYISTSIPKCIWTIRGKIIFTGPINFLMGSYVLVADNAELRFGKYPSFCGSNIKIICFNNISLGDCVEIAWDCQIMDSSFHYVEDCVTGAVKPLTASVQIGDRVWIGNRTTITKGAIVPSDTVIASNSLVNKDFSGIGPYCLLAGTPASVKSRDFKRVYGYNAQRMYDVQYNYSRVHL